MSKKLVGALCLSLYGTTFLATNSAANALDTLSHGIVLGATTACNDTQPIADHQQRHRFCDCLAQALYGSERLTHDHLNSLAPDDTDLSALDQHPAIKAIHDAVETALGDCAQQNNVQLR